ncbi:MAG TPA: class I SAM-dependent methyltransferase [Longimicrobiaceae bacterium]|nr:class I SAM-dependent methyltransferase [Longimicrobiaceae bacterium]
MESERLAAVRRQYGRIAARYDARWSRYLDGTIERALAALEPPPAARLLDAGCGTGLLLERAGQRWPTLRLWGADASLEMLGVARERLPRVPLLAADVRLLPFPDSAFDVVVSTSSLHHWAEPEAGLRELARVTAAGGELLLSDWCTDRLPMRLFSHALRCVDASHRRAYRSGALRRMVEAAGYRVTGASRFRVGRYWEVAQLRARRLPPPRSG